MKPGSAWLERRSGKHSQGSLGLCSLCITAPKTQHINSRSVAGLGVGRFDVELVMAKGQGDWGGINGGIHLRLDLGKSCSRELFELLIRIREKCQFKPLWGVEFLTNCLKSRNAPSLFNIFYSWKEKILKLHLTATAQILRIIYCHLTQACHCCCKITAWLSKVGSLCFSHSLGLGLWAGCLWSELVLWLSGESKWADTCFSKNGKTKKYKL